MTSFEEVQLAAALLQYRALQLFVPGRTAHIPTIPSQDQQHLVQYTAEGAAASAHDAPQTHHCWSRNSATKQPRHTANSEPLLHKLFTWTTVHERAAPACGHLLLQTLLQPSAIHSTAAYRLHRVPDALLMPAAPTRVHTPAPCWAAVLSTHLGGAQDVLGWHLMPVSAGQQLSKSRDRRGGPWKKHTQAKLPVDDAKTQHMCITKGCMARQARPRCRTHGTLPREHHGS